MANDAPLVADKSGIADSIVQFVTGRLLPPGSKPPRHAWTEELDGVRRGGPGLVPKQDAIDWPEDEVDHLDRYLYSKRIRAAGMARAQTPSRERL